jgi:hypothetical protein
LVSYLTKNYDKNYHINQAEAKLVLEQCNIEYDDDDFTEEELLYCVENIIDMREEQ